MYLNLIVNLVDYSLACTFENKVVSPRKYESICFRSINEVIDEDGLECLMNAKARRFGDSEACSTSQACMAQSSHKAETIQ